MSRSKKPNTKQRISITILPTMNTMLEVLSERMGLSKSRLIEKALSVLLKKQLAADAKKLAKMKFDDLPTEDEWLRIQSPLEPYDS